MASNRTGNYVYTSYKSKYSRNRPLKDKSRKDQRRKIFTALLVAFLTGVCFLSILINAVYLSVFSNSNIRKYMCNEKNYQMVFENVYAEIENLAVANGVDMECITDSINVSYVATDMTIFANNEDGILDEFDFEGRRETIKENIYKQFRSENITITDELEQRIDNFIERIYEIYKDNINLPLWLDFLKFRYTARGYTLYIHTALIVAIGAAVIVLIRINKKYIHRGYRALCNMSWAVSFLSLMFAAVMYFNGFYKNVAITPKQFTLVIDGLADEFVKAVAVAGILFFIAGVVFLYFTEKKRAQLIQKYSHKAKSKPSVEHHQNIIDFIENNNESGNN